jgi:hypothetical protein
MFGILEFYHGQFREFIRRARDGDRDAASDLVRRYKSAIRRVVRIRLRDTRLRRVLDSMDYMLASFFVRTAMGQYDPISPNSC